MHLRRIDSEFSFWVDTGPLGRREDVSPFAGLRSDMVETLFADFLGLSRDPYVGTVGANVGYLLEGDYRSWSPPDTLTQVMEVTWAALERMRPFASMSTLEGAWQVKATMADPGAVYRLSIMAVISGDHAKLRERLEHARQRECAQENGVCEQFRAFEARLMAYANAPARLA